MKALILAFLLPFHSFAGTEVLKLSSDRATYAVGETAILRAQLLTKPDNENFEFDLVGSLDGMDLPLERITEFEAFSQAPNLQASSYLWEVSVVIQDRRLARDLKISLQQFDASIALIDEELASSTDPDRIAFLQGERSRYERLKSAASAQLSSIRTHVQGPLSLTFSAL